MKLLFFKSTKRIYEGIVGKQSSLQSFSREIVFITALLCVIGIIMVYDSSVALAIRDFSDRFYYVKDQAKWMAIGWLSFYICVRLPYKFWYTIALPLLLVTIVFLLIVFIPGVGIRTLGANRWINMGFFVLQPAELAKLALVIYLSAWFCVKERKRFIAFLMLMGTVVGLIILEPDLGTSLVVICIGVLLYFFSGAPVKHFAWLMPVLITGVVILSLVSPYRYKRLTSFFRPGEDPLGASYQIRQATLALGSGGLFGVGIGKSRQKYQYLPEANTDSIFAIIGEETGFIGSVALIGIYLLLGLKGFQVASRVRDPFGRLIASGVTSWIVVQTGINVGANTALIPLTGVPLPLISYGGSSTIVMLTALGILTNVSRETTV